MQRPSSQRGARPDSRHNSALQKRRDWTQDGEREEEYASGISNNSSSFPAPVSPSYAANSSHDSYPPVSPGGGGPYSQLFSVGPSANPMLAPAFLSSHQQAHAHRPPSSQRAPSTLPSPSLPSASRPTSSAQVSRFAQAPQSVPLHALRARGATPSGNASANPAAGLSGLLVRNHSDESLGSYPSLHPSPNPVSPYTDEEEEPSRSHTSSASSIASAQSVSHSTAPSAPSAHSKSSSYLPPAGANSGAGNANSSPRKKLDAANATSLHYHVPPPKTAASASLSAVGGQRLQRGLGSTPPPARPATSMTTPTMMQQAGGGKLYDLSSPAARMKLSTAGGNGLVSTVKPVRAVHHLSSSSSATNTSYLASSHDPADSSLNHHARSSSSFPLASSSSSSSASSGVYNIWSRDTSANRVGASTGRGSHHQHGVTARPTTSHASVRPVTARPGLFSARADEHAEPNPYTQHYDLKPTKQGPDARTQTASVGSTGAQARARSAHVVSMRPPSRQRPPNQALHLGGEDIPVGSTASARARQGWNHAQQGGGHALNPVVDLFPAAPVELVRAVKSASRVRPAPNARGHSPPSPLPDDWDTEDTDTTSIGTDGDEGSSIDRESQANSLSPMQTDEGVASLLLRSDDASFSFEAADKASVVDLAPGFVSLHNILQLQSEVVAPSARKSRSNSARKREQQGEGGQREDGEGDTSRRDHPIVREPDQRPATTATVVHRPEKRSGASARRPVSRPSESATRRQAY